MVDLSIIIVSWNVADFLRCCLNSILACPVDIGIPEYLSCGSCRLSVEIIVVDNASTDNSAEVLQGFSNVHPLFLSTNMGFSAASNVGLSLAHGRYLMLLNPDTEIIGTVLEDLVQYLDDHPKVGIVGPRTLNWDGTTQPTKRNYPTFSTSLFSLRKNSPHAPGTAPNFISDYYYANKGDETDIFEVDWVQGSAIAVRRELYNQIGGLDEQFWMYHEEIDWCRRAKSAGWLVVYVGETSILHHQGRSAEKDAERSLSQWKQSRIRYFRKHHGLIGAVIQQLLFFTDQYCPPLIRFLQFPFWCYSILRQRKHQWADRISAL